MILLVQTDRAVPGLVPAVRTRIAAIDRTVLLYMVTTVAEALDRYLLQRRFQAVLLRFFAATALLLAAIGIYGLIQYSVTQRTREIGVRVALGSSSGRVVSMILRQGLSLALPGLAAGMVCALLLSRALSALFFGVAASDKASIVVTAAVLLLTTIAACYILARRAARVDPKRSARRGCKLADQRGGGRSRGRRLHGARGPPRAPCAMPSRLRLDHTRPTGGPRHGHRLLDGRARQGAVPRGSLRR